MFSFFWYILPLSFSINNTYSNISTPPPFLGWDFPGEGGKNLPAKFQISQEILTETSNFLHFSCKD